MCTTQLLYLQLINKWKYSVFFYLFLWVVQWDSSRLD